MAPLFCSVCGNILDISTNKIIKCDCCGEANPNTVISETIITTTRPQSFPSILRNKLVSKTQVVTSKDRESNLRVVRECPDCEAKEMSWSEVQLRSADEGTTIFYRCLNCGHREKEDN